MKIKKIIQSAKSWKDLNKTLENFTKSNRSKLAGDIFEYLTKLYLEIAPQYKSKLKRVYLEKEVPSNLRKKLNLPDTDEGIDLIAETNDREYWAVQCKYRSNSNETLTIKEDLSTFNNLAFTHCKNITHAIVCATVNKPPKKIKLLKSIGFELLETWLGLDDGDLFTQIKAKCVGKKYKPTILKPRPHQVAAIKKTIDHFKSNERGKIIMPCGTGKSLTAFWIAKKMGVKSILVAVPSLALLQQTLKVWTREFLINGIEPEWFCVCSDGTVKDDQDDYVTDTSDLGIKVDTDPKLIKQFLRKKTSKIKVLFTTYQSGRATAKGSRGFTYDLGIMDEAHKTVGSKTKEMAHLLHQKNVKIKKRISMTATERLFRGDSDEFMSMDDPRDYGGLIYELSFKQAINSKPPIISDYKIITFGITVPEIEEIYNSNKYLEVKKVLKDITARELATALALRKAIKQYKINNAISFHRSIRRADNFRTQQDLITKIYPEYGKLKSFHVAGNMPTANRATQMREFAKGKGLMTNARCLTEGVDLPAIDCVCFTDPKRSKVDIVQAAGRALRLSKGKKFGYILIPIFIPAGVDFNEAAKEQGFDDVAITVRSLATTDIRIAEYLRAISEGKKPRGGSPVDGLTSVNSLYKVEAEEFDKAIKLKVWDKVAVNNYRSYKDAIDWLKPFSLNNIKEYTELYKNNKDFPLDIPRTPNYFYNNFTWGEYLSTGFIATQLRKYRSYEEANKFFISKKDVNSQTDFNELKKNKNFPDDIPRNPATTYSKKWKDWGTFLTGIKSYKNSDKKDFFVNYSKFQKKIRSLKINTLKKFEKYRNSHKYPFNFPKAPDQNYKNEGWTNFPTLFGRKTFSEMVKIISNIDHVVSPSSYRRYIRNVKKQLIYPYPTNPDMVYKKYFNKKGGWFNFLNIKKKLSLSKEQFDIDRYEKKKFPKVKKIKKDKYDKFFLTYVKAKKFIKKYNIKSTSEWLLFRDGLDFPKKFIPTSPASYYKEKGWISWPDFLSKKNFIAFHLREYKTFDQCKIYAQVKKIETSRKWMYHTRTKEFKNLNFPTKPQRTYSKQWKGWPDFLGKKK